MSENKPEIDDGGPAFPHDEWTKDGNHLRQYNGMTLRAYAAIKLRMPYSGIDWLDKMIWMSKRDEFAGQAMTGWLAGAGNQEVDKGTCRIASEQCYSLADAMMKARET